MKIYVQNFCQKYYFADSIGKLFGGWVAGVNDVNQYWEIDFNEEYRIQQILLQGREDEAMWVTSFKILYPKSNGTVEYTDGNGVQVRYVILIYRTYR